MVGSGDTVHVWDVTGGEEVRTLHGHSSGVNSVCGDKVRTVNISRLEPSGERAFNRFTAPPAYGLVISFRLPFPYIQTQECLVSN